MLHQLFHTACGATGAAHALQIYVCNICTRREHGAAARARGAAGCARMLPRRYEFFTFSGFLKVIYFMWQVRNSVSKDTHSETEGARVRAAAKLG